METGGYQSYGGGYLILLLLRQTVPALALFLAFGFQKMQTQADAKLVQGAVGLVMDRAFRLANFIGNLGVGRQTVE